MRSAMKLPRPPGSAPKIPVNKENHEASWDRRRKIGRDIFGVRAMSEPRIRVRQAFSTVNARQETGLAAEMGQITTPSGSISGRRASNNMAMTREDIEVLLNMKMRGKNKFDYKGKCEQMMDYIKKLRACIRWFQELESSYILQKEKLQKQLLDDRRDCKLTEDLLRGKQDELEMGLSELKTMCASLEEKLSRKKAEKEDLLLAREKDAVALQAAKEENTRLLGEVDNARMENLTASQQVATLQDVNKKLQEYNTSLQLYNSKLQSEATSAAETIFRTQKEKSATMEALSSLRGHAAALQEQLAQAQTSIEDRSSQNKACMDELDRLYAELHHVMDDRDQQAARVEALTTENAQYKECTGKTTAELELLNSKTTALEEGYSSQREQIESFCLQLKVANHKLQVAETSIKQHISEGANQRLKMEDLQSRLVQAELQIHEGEQLRRELHNTVLELKGNIRVFCRVRPLLPEDDSTLAEPPVVQYPTSIEMLGRGIDLIQAQGQKQAFTFDKVFGPEVGQSDVFVEISQLIQSALDGYKVCIFAYGQTGSGKTYTMLGNPDIPEQRGVIPRSLEQIFKSSEALSTQGWSFRMQASMLEIYNETIRDLLVNGRNDNGTPTKQHVIKHDQSGKTIVSDLTLVNVTNWKEVSSLLHRAAQSRAIGKTSLNEQSSRSHCVFTLRISGLNQSTEEQVHGILNLIDLAGSERLSRSGSIGDRLKETQAINKSLASLGDVILAIANREQHIPYRNSKLTYLLQPCLGGDAKTLMFVNLSPDRMSINESLCSLRFAAKVNACEIGVPRRQTHTRMVNSRLSFD